MTEPTGSGETHGWNSPSGHLLPAPPPCGNALHDARMPTPDIAGKDRRREEADDLPIGKIPRHHREDRTLRQPAAFGAPAARQVPEFRLQHRRAMLGVVMQQARAFLDLGARLGNRLAHLGDGELGQLVRIGLVEIAEFRKHCGSLVERACAPVAICAGSGFELRIDAVFIERFVFGDGLAGRGVGGRNHGSGSDRVCPINRRLPGVVPRYLRRKRKYQTSWP